jgi:WD40 repeat protein
VTAPKAVRWDQSAARTPEPPSDAWTPGSPVANLAFTPDGESLVAGYRDGSIRTWPTREEGQSRPLSPSDGADKPQDVLALDIAVHPQKGGEWLLATGHADGRVLLWDLASRRQIAELSELGKLVVDVALSPDGRYMATVVREKALINVPSRATLWDLRDPGRPQALGNPLLSYQSPLSGALFGPNPNVKTLALIGEEMDLWLWNVDVENWKGVACELAGCNLTREQWAQYAGEAVEYRSVCSGAPLCTHVESSEP